MVLAKSMTLDDEIDRTLRSAPTLIVPASDEDVFIDKLRAGDEAAFEQLIDRCSGDVHALLYRLTEDPEEARDLTQDTFLRALRAIKGFRGDAAEHIFRLSRIDRFGFDVEALRLARTLGYRVAEIPVACTYRPSSSVRRIWDAASMVADLLRARWYEATGRYAERPPVNRPQ